MLSCVTAGSYGTNCYLLTDEDTGETLAVDCPVFDGAYRAFLERSGVKELRYILLTHGHFDHVCGVKELKDACGGKICIHTLDAACLWDPDESLSSKFGSFTQTPTRADILL